MESDGSSTADRGRSGWTRSTPDCLWRESSPRRSYGHLGPSKRSRSSVEPELLSHAEAERRLSAPLTLSRSTRALCYSQASYSVARSGQGQGCNPPTDPRKNSEDGVLETGHDRSRFIYRPRYRLGRAGQRRRRRRSCYWQGPTDRNQREAEPAPDRETTSVPSVRPSCKPSHSPPADDGLSRVVQVTLCCICSSSILWWCYSRRPEPARVRNYRSSSSRRDGRKRESVSQSPSQGGESLCLFVSQRYGAEC